VNRPRLLVIVGPTGSGKSRLALETAELLGGEIVSADAFAVYRGMDIGTDKPDAEARRRVVHHLLDIADPHERFSAGDFLRAADDAIAGITSRGRVPVVAGGTHFYVRALLLGLFPSPPHDPVVRERLEREWENDPAALVERLRRVDPEAASRIPPRDRQRILRALEVHELTGTPLTEHWRRHETAPRYPALLAVPRRNRAALYARIDARVERMFGSGLVEEVESLLASGVRPDSHAMKAIGYREVVAHLEGRIGLGEAVRETMTATRNLAKRQITWLRHMKEGTPRAVPPAERGGAERLAELWRETMEDGGEP